MKPESKKVTCRRCGEKFSPLGGGHCNGCCRTFTSDWSFDAHRQGPFTARYCLDVVSEFGWRETPRGWTNRAEQPDGTYLN